MPRGHVLPIRSAAASACARIGAVLVLLLATQGPLAADALYDEAIAALDQAAGALEPGGADQAAGHLDLYLGQAASSRWRIERLHWQFDGGEPAEQQLSREQAAGLAESDTRLRLARLSPLRAEQGLEINLSISDRGNPGGPSRRLRQSLSLAAATDPQQDQSLELIVVGSLLGAPAIELRRRTADAGAAAPGIAGRLLPALAGDRYRPGSNEDPALHWVQALRLEQAYEQADRELLAIARRAGSEAALPFAWHLEQLRVANSAGRLDRASDLGSHLAEQSLDAASAAALAVEHLALADARLAAGDVEAAEALLPLAARALPIARLPDWRHLQGRLLLARQRPADAVAALDRGDLDDDAYRYMQQSIRSVRDTACRRYNLAIAMLRDGDQARARSWLDLLGRNGADDSELQALRDRANLALGWHFLQAGQGRSALGVLGRIPIDGLQANRALLGMGWALLAPDGERQARPDLERRSDGRSRRSSLPAALQSSLLRLGALEPELNGAPAPTSFERDRAPKRRDDALRAAIAVWQPLQARDPREFAVLEAGLAIAHARDQLREAAAAQAAYRESLHSLKQVEADLAVQRAAIEAGAFDSVAELAGDRAAFDAAMDRLQLPYDERSALLYAQLLDAWRWQKLELALREQSDRRPASAIEYVGAALAEPAAIDETSLPGRIDARRRQLLDQASRAALGLLDQRGEQLRRYLQAALFALARLEELPQLEARGAVDCSRGCR